MMTSSPYHASELLVQQRLGERPIAERNGLAIRTTIAQSGALLRVQQPMVIASSLGPTRQVWKSGLHGIPGFAYSPLPHQLALDADLLAVSPTYVRWTNQLGDAVRREPAFHRLCHPVALPRQRSGPDRGRRVNGRRKASFSELPPVHSAAARRDAGNRDGLKPAPHRGPGPAGRTSGLGGYGGHVLDGQQRCPRRAGHSLPWLTSTLPVLLRFR